MSAHSLDWQDQAICKGSPIEWFFDSKYRKRALAMCSKCPVQTECLNYRLVTVTDKNEDSGIWGMTTAWQRHKMRLASKQTA
jgi:predicted restriction endonuclease